MTEQTEQTEQLRMPPVTCSTCGQRWPAPGPQIEPADLSFTESMLTVHTMPDGSIMTVETITKIEPAPVPAEIGPDDGATVTDPDAIAAPMIDDTTMGL